MNAAFLRSGLRAGIALLMLAIGACSGGGDDDEDTLDREAFEAARQKWTAARIEDYQFTLTKDCYCLSSGDTAGAGRYVIQVRGGVVAQAFDAVTGEYLSDAAARSLPTLSGLFDILDQAHAREADEIEARYEQTLGYPVEVDIDYDERSADDEVEYRVNDFM